MVAERYLASADQPFPNPTRASFQAMAHPMLRGAQMAGGDAFMRSASAGLIGMGLAGEVATNRARAWCQQRRGRRQTDVNGHLLSPIPLSIHSTLSTSWMQCQSAQPLDAETWKIKYERVQEIVNEKIANEDKWVEIVQYLENKDKKMEKDNEDLKLYMDNF